MKYQLETIPVWEAFKQNTECPLCLLEERKQKDYINFFLGDSVMDPETRKEVNQKGFCAAHMELLFQGGHKLGLALIAHTHLQEFMQKFKKIRSNIILCKESVSDKSAVPKFFKKHKNMSSSLKELNELLSIQKKKCLFCERLNNTLRRYAFTIVYLWKKDKEFAKNLQASRGFCLPHLILMIGMAEDNLSDIKLNEFLKIVILLEEKNLERLEQELYWFIQKFDYRNQAKPWKTSKDALPRTLQKLAGKVFIESK